MDLKKKISFLYILGQIVPTFLLGIFVFIFIILMFQFLRLTELILIHNVGIFTILYLLFNISMSFIPLILPMSLLFSVLLSYSRLSADSEIVAFKALGYSPQYLALPAVLFSAFISILSAQTLFQLGPQAEQKASSLIHKIGSQKVLSAIQEGTFSESFFDLVLYTNEINKETNTLHDLFIYDQRNKKSPLAITAKQGKVTTSSSANDQSVDIILTDGEMYKLDDASHTKVKFETFDLNIVSPIATSEKVKTIDSYTFADINRSLKETNITEERLTDLKIALHGRWAIAAACLLFGFLGTAIGSRTNRRSNSSSGFILSVICIIAYWVMYVSASILAKKMYAPPGLLLWIPNTIFLLFTIYSWKKHLTE